MNRTWMIAAAMLLVACGRTSDLSKHAELPEMIKIARPSEALTFARIQGEAGPELLAVASLSETKAMAFNLTRVLGPDVRDPIALHLDRGYEAVQAEIERGFAGPLLEIAVDRLILPVDLTDAHIAAGTNFAAHAEESSVEEGPFLFAKLVRPTPFHAPVSAGDGLLDYEVELAFVTLTDAALPKAPETMGLILANDFTDRALLMRHLNPRDVTSGDGFTTGKSPEGYLPLGCLFVIPRDLRKFVAETELQLSVNGEPRQKASMTMAIWDLDELFRQIDARKEAEWEHEGAMVRLPVENATIPARTLILAGTPDGTVFQGIPKSTMAAGLLRWLAFGWNESAVDRVIERYIAGAKKKGNFLQPGDRVSIRVERMGMIETPVEP